MAISLLDLPTEILLDLLHFTSFQCYHALLCTSKAFHPLIKETAVVISHSCPDNNKQSDFTISTLNHFNIDQISLTQMDHLIPRYQYFILDVSGPVMNLPGFSTSNTMSMIKIMLRSLQNKRKYHTVVISSFNFNEDVLMRSLMPKFNSKYLEFYIPKTRQISGFEDLRVLDNTRCYFSNLERLTIGSSSFQLFDCTAPKLEVFDYSNQMVTQTIYDTINVKRLSYTKFLSVLARSCAKNVRCLEVLGHVESEVLNQFENLKVLSIYGDHCMSAFDVSAFVELEKLVVSKCNGIEQLINLSRQTGVNTKLKVLDLSLNKGLTQTLRGAFTSLGREDLSSTTIGNFPLVNTPVF